MKLTCFKAFVKAAKKDIAVFKKEHKAKKIDSLKKQLANLEK